MLDAHIHPDGLSARRCCTVPEIDQVVMLVSLPFKAAILMRKKVWADVKMESIHPEFEIGMAIRC